MDTKIRRRSITYIASFVTLFLGYYHLRNSTWQGSTDFHTIMETVATLLALMVAVLALVRFYTKKNNTFLFIGTGFFGTALLDGYHTIVTSQWFDYLWPSPPPHLIPWSWNASRVFLSTLMLLSWWAWRREERLGEEAGQIGERGVYGIVGGLTLISFLFFAFYPLPQAYYPGLIFGRPEEFVSAAFFLFALIGYLWKGAWKSDTFEHWVVLSLIVGFMGQAVFMPFSFKLFDMMFDVAHLLKKVSYTFVLTGLLISMYYLFRRAEESAKEILRANEALQMEIIERGHAQEALKKYSERQQEMVNDRTKELQEAQEELIRKERLAILGQMAGAVNHELRNPLGVIKNSVYYLKMVLPEDENVRKHLGILEREVGTASRIVSGLLDLARPHPLTQVQTDLSEPVREGLEQTPLEENIRVVTNLPGDLPPVSVDPEQVKRVVCNLIVNAAQAMPDGGTLTIETAQADGGALVVVSDTGVGIARENLEKIFEPLFTTKAKGIGLGLYLARRLTESCGGTIVVESTAGSGSRFVVRFDAQKSDQQQEEGH